MEQNCNLEIYGQECPNTSCRKSTNSRGIRYVYIPASLGDDQKGSSVAPRNGAYSNAVVYYGANGAVYIYSREGIPVETNVSDAELSEKIKQLEIEKANRTEVDAALALKQDLLTAGSGISIINNVITNTRTTLPWGNITGQISDQNDLANALSAKQNVIDASHKLDADYVDDTNSSHKFATASQLAQIGTNATNISSLQNNKQDITDNSLNTVSKTVPGAINEVDSIAKGANQALSFSNYSSMVAALNLAASDIYNVGQNVMVVTLDVPDLWVSGVESTSVPYSYTTDSAFVSALTTDGYVQVGYYKLSALETQKVDLTNYVTFTDYSTTATAGVSKNNNDYGTTVYDGTMSTYPADNTDIDSRTETSTPASSYVANTRRPITPGTVDYAVRKCVASNKGSLSGAEKTSSQEWLGFVKLTQAQYDALVSGGTVDSNTYYFIIEE